MEQNEPVIIHKIDSEENSDKRRFKFNFKKPTFPKIRRRILLLIGIPVILLLITGFLIYRVIKEGKEFYASAKDLSETAQKQDVKAIKEGLQKVKKEQKDLKNAYSLILFTKYIPFLGSFVSDGEHAINAVGYGLETAEESVNAFEPYSDILGFSTDSTESNKSGEKTAQERLDFIVNSLPEIIPKVDVISEKLSKARGEIELIKTDKYPKKLFGKQIQTPLREVIDGLVSADEFVKKAKPLLGVSPYLLGGTEKRTYLVLFQNDKELRPTGGFMTAYTIAEVEKGKFNPVSSSDIYSLDAKYKPSVKAPEEFINYIKGPYVLNKNFRLRDMNWSPDFKESIELFLAESKKVGIDKIDGVIGVDTHLLVNILNVLGPIGVPGFGNFSTNIEPKCNCPQVIYELESFADVEGPVVWDPLNPNKIIYAPANYDNRKKIIGPLMNSILSNTLAQPKEKFPQLFNALFKSITEKHVLLYIHDDKAQAAAESFGIAGRIENSGDDYLHINDSNLGGRKSNLYASQEVRQSVKINASGEVEKTLEIIYKNPQGYDGWLNSVLPNWTRIYLPKGSEIKDVTGFEDKGNVYEEFGKTVVSGGFKLRPQGISTITVTYKLPFKIDRDYKILIQKQPGTDAPLYSMEVNKQSEEFFLNTDRELKFRVK